MKRKSYFIGLICLALAFGLCAAPAQATMPTYGLSLETKDGSGNGKTVFAVGEKLYLHIIATELQGVAGCAFTLNYDPAVLTAPATVTGATNPMDNGLPVNPNSIISLFPFTFVKAGHADDGAVTMRENSATAGKILFSGASINTATGGAKNTTSTSGSAFPLFIVEFTVKSNAAIGTGYAFSLVQTTLHNPDAGYGTVGGSEQVPVPLLVGAAPKPTACSDPLSTACTSDPWSNLTDSTAAGAFPVLLSSLGTVAKTFDVVAQQLYTIGGTVAYTPVTGHAKGYQSGNLIVAAFATSDTGYTTPIGVQSIAWPQGTASKTFTLSVPNGDYYLGAYIDTNSSNTRDAWEATGEYRSSVIAISGGNDATTRAFSIADPIDGPSGEPKFYVKWKTDNGWTAIGAMLNDYDKDGYSNIQEYINRKADPSHFNPSDKTNLDAQGGTGYSASTDSRVQTTAPWTPITGQENNMVAYGTAYDGQNNATTGDWVGAFGPGGLSDCRAVAQVGEGGSYFLAIVGNINGDKISFKLKRAADSKTIDALENVTFAANATEANKVLHFSESRRQTIALLAGWNWVSFNGVPADTSFSAFFGANAALVEQVKTQTAAALNGTSGWFGNLPDMGDIANGLMFKIKTSQAFTLDVDGTPVDPTKAITLNSGWTWIAYLPNASATVETAVAGVMDKLVQIKSQTAAALKSETGLFGNLVNMDPGKGYVIKTSAVGTLTYPVQ